MQRTDLIITGSLAFDTVKTRDEQRYRVLGGAAVYASVAAAKFCRPGIVSIAGRDFPDEYRDLLTGCGVDITGLVTGSGETFSWSGSYEADTNEAVTIDTRLNVFSDFDPRLPGEYKSAETALLGNLDPALQLQVLGDNPGLKFTACDTMNFWIEGAPDLLREVFGKVSVIFINEKEASMFTGERSLIPLGQRLLEYGPEAVIIKLGKYGAAGFSRDGDIFLIPCVPLDYDVVDPT
ncbi:MAG: sugar kinase, partial [Abditibacteriota bacterium]|nr:sugar kinase [Abditibacteriota bacterium]